MTEQKTFQLRHSLNWSRGLFQNLMLVHIAGYMGHIVKKAKRFQINDFGCGKGEIMELLLSAYQKGFEFGPFEYNGYDRNQDSLDIAKEIYPEANLINFELEKQLHELRPEAVDLSVCSGTFHVIRPFEELLEIMAKTTRYIMVFDALLSADFDKKSYELPSIMDHARFFL